MKWIILLMILFIAPYTYINLHYRKVGPSFQPYQDARERRRVGQAGYTRVTLTVARPADLQPRTPVEHALPAPGGLPADLRSALFVAPLLPAAIGPVDAAATADADTVYRIEFVCTLSDIKQQLGGAQLYVKGSDIFVLADFEPLSDGLLARSRQNLIVLTVAGRSLAPGQYRMVLVGTSASKAWTLQVH